MKNNEIKIFPYSEEFRKSLKRLYNSKTNTEDSYKLPPIISFERSKDFYGKLYQKTGWASSEV